MILLIGAPCSGKSTVGRLFCQQTQRKLVVLDDFIDKAILADNIKKGVSLTDEFIERVVERFIQRMRSGGDRDNSVYELPFHNYESLFVNKLLEQQAIVICLYCDKKILIDRNSLRGIEKQIPVNYIMRCDQSVEKLKGMRYDKIHFFDTGKKTPQESVIEIITALGAYD